MARESAPLGAAAGTAVLRAPSFEQHRPRASGPAKSQWEAPASYKKRPYEIHRLIYRELELKAKSDGAMLDHEGSHIFMNVLTSRHLSIPYKSLVRRWLSVFNPANRSQTYTIPYRHKRNFCGVKWARMRFAYWSDQVRRMGGAKSAGVQGAFFFR